MTLNRFLVGLAFALALGCAGAEPLVPRSDAELIETLPSTAGERAQERQLRRQWAADPTNAGLAVALARRQLEQARHQGDPRHAGQALAVLQAWPDPDTAPDEVLLMRATVEQHLHEFDAAAGHLERLLQRRPQHAQAWLTLATVRRVQGRYAESDRACDALAAAGAAFHAQACRAENAGLRGQFDPARQALRRLVATPRLAPDLTAWLWTTLAELESRAGRVAEADAAYRTSLAAQPDGYTSLSYADWLIAQGRAADALARLQGQPRHDAVLLRLAIVGAKLRSSQAPRDRQELRERMAAASLRPAASTTHAREQAMFALWVDVSPQRALELARANVRHQREPLDLLLLAQAARAAGDASALREAASLRKDMGLHDRRLEALL